MAPLGQKRPKLRWLPAAKSTTEQRVEFVPKGTFRILCGGLKAACLRVGRIKSPASRSTHIRHRRNVRIGFRHLTSSRQAPTGLAHLLSADQILIWLLTNFSKNVL